MRMSIAAITAIAAILAGCATQPAAQPDPEAEQKALADRITQICSLPDAEREAEIEKLKKETGMVLYCGRK